MADTTVDLSADEDIKQLAHDVVRDENEYAVPLLRDFYTFLAVLDEEDHVKKSDLVVEDTESDIHATGFRNLLDTLENNDIVEEHPDNTTTYTLDKTQED
jgi:hypothetical protein